ncbi:aspartic-type endopeptidase activity protein [Homalodisca vitripennis]|nr:aspartic-type endopeptidase activity protein [Homalodisca vitripennis]
MSQTNVKFAITTRSRSRLGHHTELREIKVDEAFSVIEEDRDLGECAQELDLEALSCSSSSSSISLPEDLNKDDSSSEEVMAEARGPVINPTKFKGGFDDNVEEYLAHFERVARANGWDESKKLLIILCYLEGAALKWYENIEESCLNVGETEGCHEGCFPAYRVGGAGEEESVEAYVQDGNNLCTKVDNQMSERSKIKHVLLGLKPSLLEKVMVMTNNSLNELLTNIRKIQTSRFMAGQRVDNLLGDPIRETNPVGYPKGPESQMATPSSTLESKIENLTSEQERR